MELVWLRGGRKRRVIFAFMKFAWKAVTAVEFSFETSLFVNNTSAHESYPIYDFRLRANFVFFTDTYP
jgi:hypothetical protein